MPKRTRSYSAWQMEKLANPQLAVGYLNAALGDSQEAFLVALRKVSKARQMAAVARGAGVQRETLYHALSEEGNPTLQTLSSILSFLGMEISIRSKTKGYRSRANADGSIAAFTSAEFAKGSFLAPVSTGHQYGALLWQKEASTETALLPINSFPAADAWRTPRGVTSDERAAAA